MREGVTGCTEQTTDPQLGLKVTAIERHVQRSIIVDCIIFSVCQQLTNLETYVFCFEYEFYDCRNFQWKLFILFLVTNIFIYLVRHYIKIPDSQPTEKMLYPTTAEYTFFQAHREHSLIQTIVLGHKTHLIVKN